VDDQTHHHASFSDRDTKSNDVLSSLLNQVIFRLAVQREGTVPGLAGLLVRPPSAARVPSVKLIGSSSLTTGDDSNFFYRNKEVYQRSLINDHHDVCTGNFSYQR